MKKIVLIIALMLSANSHAECTINMVFKMGDKSPLMHAAPDNSGILNDLYTEAARRINCKLTIARLPKQRLHQGLKKGAFDFYPAASFSEERSHYLHYIPNGLKTSEYGVSSLGIPPIEKLSELREHPSLIWLMESNSSKEEVAQSLGIDYQKVKYLNIDKVIEFISKRPHFKYFYIADKEVLDVFLAKNSVKDFSTVGLRIHQYCCGKSMPMYMGFSRYSQYSTILLNERFDMNKQLSSTNQKIRQKQGSVAYELHQALQDMNNEGVTQNIYLSWYQAL